MTWSPVVRIGLCLSLVASTSCPLYASEKGDAPDGAEQPAEQPKRTAPGAMSRTKAKDATERATKASAAGKDRVADRLKRAAQLWNKVAEAQERAARLEEEAAKIERTILDLRSQARRARSLVEQTEARRARALARLMELGLEKSGPAAPEEEAPKQPAKPAAAGAK